MKTAILMTGILLSNLGLAKEMECQVEQTKLSSFETETKVFTMSEGVLGGVGELFGYEIYAMLNYGQIVITAKSDLQTISANSSEKSWANLRFQNALEIAEVTCKVK